MRKRSTSEKKQVAREVNVQPGESSPLLKGKPKKKDAEKLWWGEEGKPPAKSANQPPERKARRDGPRVYEPLKKGANDVSCPGRGRARRTTRKGKPNKKKGKESPKQIHGLS